MATMIIDRSLEATLLAQRRATGADRYDEVWEGIRMMAPMPNTEHQQIVSRLIAILEETVGWPGLGIVVPGVNVSGREVGWEQDFRVPDVAVALPEGNVRDRGTHWCGGPDFLVEVMSPDDQTRQKLPFYAGAAAREVLLIDRQPWSVELYQLDQGELKLRGRSTVEEETVLRSLVLPLTFQLVQGSTRPAIEVAHAPSGKKWNV